MSSVSWKCREGAGRENVIMWFIIYHIIPVNVCVLQNQDGQATEFLMPTNDLGFVSPLNAALPQESLVCYDGSFSSGRRSLSVSIQSGFLSSISGQLTWGFLTCKVSRGSNSKWSVAEKYSWNLMFLSMFNAFFQMCYATNSTSLTTKGNCYSREEQLSVTLSWPLRKHNCFYWHWVSTVRLQKWV